MLMVDYARVRSENCGVSPSREAEESKARNNSCPPFLPEVFASKYTENVTFIVSRCGEGMQIVGFNRLVSNCEGATKNLA